MKSPPSRGNGRRALFGAALIAALVGPGCGLLLDLEPPDGDTVECLVTVVNAEGIEVDISDQTHPDFIEAVPSFGGSGIGGGPSSSGSTRPIRPYYTCASGCSTGCPVADTAEAEADFRRWLAQRINEVASGPESDSPFFVHDGPWCVKEVDGGASTLQCRQLSSITRDPECAPPISAEPLPGCPGTTPPMGTCVELECLGGPCPGISFAETPIGSEMRETVVVRNCGGADDDSIAVVFDPGSAVLPVLALADFRIEDDPSQPCAPRTPEEAVDGRVLQLSSVDPLESECRFEVIFAPEETFAHEAEIVFNTTPVSPVRLQVRGTAIGGTLTAPLPEEACLLLPAPDTCTAIRAFLVTNPGPGTVTITDAFFDAAGAANFSILRPTPADLPLTLAPMASTEFRVQWCPGAPDPRIAGLTIVSNADPPFPEQTFRVALSTCPPGTE